MARPIKISSGVFTLLVSAYIAIVLNIAFWARLTSVVQPDSASDWLFIAALVGTLVAIFNAALSLAAFPFVLKPTVAIFVLTSAIVGYFTWEYGTAIDVNMVHNVLETDSKEVGDLLTWRLIGFVLLLGILPSLMILAAPVSWPPAFFGVSGNSSRAMISGGVAAALIFVNFATIASTMRANRDLPFMLVPSNVISAVARYIRTKEVIGSGRLRPYGRDAYRDASMVATSRPLVTVLVVGETARSANFSLYGYGRMTNPRLSAVRDLLTIKQATSCSTDTAHSLPCMFSGLGLAEFSVHKAAGQENLLDILRRLDLGVLWRENQSGCKGVCRGVETEMLSKQSGLAFFDVGESRDEALLQGLPERIAAMTRGGVIVLHMMGSHGPAYYKRVPPSFAQFQPTCNSNHFGNCTREQIVNSYDNTILYTDHVLAELIEMLRTMATKGVDTAMIYASDHGESLGEKGLYLHGMPRAIAPKEQIQIPMMLWFSGAAQDRLGIDMECLKEAAERKPASHDNLFHTTLGIYDIQSQLYNQKLDVLARCRLKQFDGL
jgi:lipid A ethanolaminephosphotransferase